MQPGLAEHRRMRPILTYRSRLIGAGFAAGLAIVALAGCGSSTTVTTTVTTTVSTASTASTRTESSATTSATSSAVTSTGPPLCRAATLALRILGQQGATGHGEIGVALRNTGSETCHTFGFPGVLFLDKAGGPLPTVPTHTTHDYFGPAPELGINVAPGESVSFRLGVTHGINGTQGCSTAYGLQVIPPNDTATLRATIPGGAYQCRTVTVSPVRPGTSAYQ
jgi:Domain of unknown function (DUF4232)